MSDTNLMRLEPYQYEGGYYLSPADHVKIGEVLQEVFGEYTFDVPPTCTAYWGFKAWAKWIHGGWNLESE